MFGDDDVQAFTCNPRSTLFDFRPVSNLVSLPFDTGLSSNDEAAVINCHLDGVVIIDKSSSWVKLMSYK